MGAWPCAIITILYALITLISQLINTCLLYEQYTPVKHFSTFASKIAAYFVHDETYFFNLRNGFEIRG